MTKLDSLKYLKEDRRGRKSYWLFCPPQDAIDAGVAKRETFQDGRVARKVVPELIKNIEQWKRGETAGTIISVDSTLAQVVAHYQDSRQFNSLALNSQNNYNSAFKAILGAKVGGRKAKQLRLRELTAQVCKQIYEHWLETSPAHAKHMTRVFSVLMSYCISLDIMTHNPMAKIKKVNHKKRSVIWTEQQVEDFLNVAFNDFRYRNIGLLVAMAYEWMQRPTDIRLLKWNQIDWEKKSVKITQSKRGAEVELPISDNLEDLLRQQKADFDFQEYVIPHLRASDKSWRPYTRRQIAALVNEVLEKAGLPLDLRAGDLRKTGINEAVQAGVDITSLMSVTGHRNINSLTPYMKPTLESAKTALDIRRRNKDA